MSTTVRDLLSVMHQSEVFTVQLTASVFEAARISRSHKISALIVLDSEDAYCGIYTERDGSWDVLAENLLPSSVKIGQVMTPKDKVVMVNENDTVDFCMAEMRRLGVRHLPVERNGQPVAIISERDIMSHFGQNYQLLEDMVTSRR